MKNKNEQRLKELVLKWTNYFRWRKDFLKWQEQRIWQENYQETIICFLEKFIPDLKNKKILDLGCGMGGFLIAMCKEGYNVRGLDQNRDYCEITELRGERHGIRAVVVNAGGEKMPFTDSSFDFVFCNDVLEHCVDPGCVLREAYRVLSAAGCMYVTVINRFGFSDPHYHLKFINWMPKSFAETYIGWRHRNKKGLPHQDRQRLRDMHYFAFGQFKKMAEEIGFKVTDLKECKLKRVNLIGTTRFKKVLALLKLLKIDLPVYRLARTLYVGGFELMLEKK